MIFSNKLSSLTFPQVLLELWMQYFEIVKEEHEGNMMILSLIIVVVTVT